MKTITPSKRIQELEASPTLALVTKAKELISQGKDVISLSVGEPDWPSFEVAKSAGIKAINDNFTKYTPARGIAPLREAIAAQVNKDFSSSYTANHVTVATGGKFVIYSLLYSLINPGEEVLIPTPFWVSYPSIVQLCGGENKLIKTTKESNFKLTAKQLEASISDKTRVLILNSPSNPTGFLYSQEELNELAQVIKKYPQLICISDDIYNRLSFDFDVSPHLLNSPTDISEQLFIVNGISKTYSMTGWRIGWAIGSPSIMAGMGKFQSQTTSSCSSVSQMAAISAITDGDKELQQAKVLLKKRRDYTWQEINNIDGMSALKPEGAFYIWADVSSSFGKKYDNQLISNSSDFAKLLLENYSVVVVPGEPFGEDGFVRISYAIKEDRMKEALDRLTSFFKKL